MSSSTGLLQRTRQRLSRSKSDLDVPTGLATPEPEPALTVEPSPYTAAGPFGGAPFTARTDDGLTLRGAVRGEGPAVILVHCWTGDRNVWAEVANSLVAAGNRVVVYDQRGHGLSDESDATPSIERLAKDLTIVMDRLDIDSAVIAGHSLGGMAALQQAIERPERVSALALVSTGAGHLPRPLRRRWVASLVSWLLSNRLAQFLVRSPIGWVLARVTLGSKPPKGAVDLTLAGARRTSARTRGTQMGEIAMFNVIDQLSTIKAPAHVLVGSRDTLTPVWHARTMQKKIRDCERTTLPKAGHMLPLERPDAVYDVISDLARAQSLKKQ